MFQVAVYGKGGIGKSTMSANISVSLAKRGCKVMQVGCDPKHDSTRLLLGGGSQMTVLDYVRSTPIARRCLEDVVETGTEGVLCTEAGGPEPGIGCAGRGILTTFDTLKKLGADTLNVDYRIYDVLGDVVCGGFAVPLRGEYADAVILVTSGEFMALYAANNIIRGLSNFDTGSPRLLGIVLNSRGVEGEEELVGRFADAVGTDVLAVIPRDRLFADAESKGHTVAELYPDSEIAARIGQVADAIVSASEGRAMMSDPKPLDDLQLSDLAAGREIRPLSGQVSERPHCLGCSRRTSIKDTRVMSSCSAYGATAALMKVSGIAVVLHGPMSCAYLMDTSRAKAVLDLYQQGVYGNLPSHSLRCSMMDDSAAIFGGNSFLRWSLERTVGEGFRNIAVVTTCMPGIIGDDCLNVIDSVSRENPDVRIMLIPCDGDLTGEYTDGFMMAAETIVDYIDVSVEPEEGYVNLIGTSFFDVHSREHVRQMERMFSLFGLKVNCRFLDETDLRSVEGFCRARTDILMSDTSSCRELMSVISRRTGREPFPVPLPTGLYAYQEWIQAMGEFTGLTDIADREIEDSQRRYDSFLEGHRHRFEGRKVMITSKLSSNVDWLVDLLDDLGAEIVRIGFAPSPRKAGGRADSRYSGRITEEYTDEMLEHDLETMKPDLLIGDVSGRASPGTRFARMVKTGVGYEPVFEYVRYLENMTRLPAEEGWRKGAIP